MSNFDAAYSTQPFRERLNAGILEAYKAEGLTVSVNGTDKPDPGKLAERVYSLLENAKVADAKEIPTKAITRADLAANVFASTPSPGSPDWDQHVEATSMEYADALWARLQKAVSDLLTPGRRGGMQKMLADKQPGTFIIATKITNAKVPAVYITSDVKLVARDFGTQKADRIKNVSVDVAEEFVYAISLNDKLRKVLESKLDKGLDQAVHGARDKLALKAGGADVNGEDGD